MKHFVSLPTVAIFIGKLDAHIHEQKKSQGFETKLAEILRDATGHAAASALRSGDVSKITAVFGNVRKKLALAVTLAPKLLNVSKHRCYIFATKPTKPS
jgi:hypothetical protein